MYAFAETRNALRGERVVSRETRESERRARAGREVTPSTARDRLSFLLSGVVGARNLTMECRKGRRKGAPILGGLLLAWLLTNDCAVVARNIGECEKVFTIPDRGGFLPRVELSPPPVSLPRAQEPGIPSLPPSLPFLRQLRGRLQRGGTDIYVRRTR